MRRLIESVYKHLSKNETSSVASPSYPISPLEPINKEDISSRLSDSWKDPSVPTRQYELFTKSEIEDYKRGIPVKPFDVLVDILTDSIYDLDCKSILEIGCSSGYYSDVLKVKGINAQYNGCDYSEAFISLARELHPTLDFQVQNACALTYTDRQFDIVISGCCLLHILEYESAIQEAARVANSHVVFHRTPVLHENATSYYIKTAYGVEMFEIHFNERELLRLFRKHGMKVVDICTFQASLAGDPPDFHAYKTYLCVRG